ncbi:DUF3108 domain-containing protein [Rhodovarius lipocyclicus]|uniref:DUF3108 domain-containing protein n=1 Tax=Rhodovarius lipocyclicus TaxID=268410 RepID=UPI001357FB92|nr:DUF3108 domain-containing protein [Rhodovarius lipocyclicus]
MRRILLPLPILGLAMLGMRPAAAAIWYATYDLHVAGLHVMQTRVTIDSDSTRYRLEMQSRSRGMLGMLSRSDQTTVVEGDWRGNTPRPRRYSVSGIMRGERREALMDYAADGRPLVRALIPSLITEDREDVAADQLSGTMDSLSALLMLSRNVAATNRCEGGARLYDTRRLSQVEARTEGQEIVPNEWGVIMPGPALRCTLESRMLGGFLRGQDPARAREPSQITAWIAVPSPGAPPLPLRVEIASRWWGRVYATLTRIEGG